MENKLHYPCLLENKHGKSFYFSGGSSYMNSRNDGLSILFDKFVSGGSRNTHLPAFKGTFHTIHSPVTRKDPVKDDVLIGVRMSVFFMKGVVSAVTATANAPFERVKLLLQNQGELIKSSRLSRPYHGITDCFVRTIKNEGVISLWRGNSVNLIKIIPHQILTSGLGTFFNRIVFKSRKERDNGTKNQNLFVRKLATDVAFLVCSSVCLYPLGFARTRLANDVNCGGQRKFKGLLDVYRRTLKSDGLVGVYRGISIGTVGLVSGYSCFRLIKEKQKRSSRLFDLALINASFVVYYPFETVQKRMVMTSGETFKYKNSFDAFVCIIKNEGIRSLYKGYGASLVSLIPGYFLLAEYRKLEKRNNRPYGGISVIIERK